MSKKNDGGPAFPGAYRAYRKNGPAEGEIVAEGGMSLRDWFAGMALMGFLSNTSRPMTRAPDDAAWCVNWADAMVAELAKREK